MPPSNKVLATIALLLERFVLPVVFFLKARDQAIQAHEIWAYKPHTEANLLEMGNAVVLMLTGFFSSFCLLIARRATVPPTKLKLILVPLFAAFFNLTYFAVDWFPLELRLLWFPRDLQAPVFLIGMAIIIVGHLIAFWSFLFLGRSFGVFVSVRKVVLTGPYRWVRHPMYLGWLVFVIGFLLTRLCAAYILIIAAHISLLIYRARLEENELAEHSPEYRQYKERTGFLFPNFTKAART